MSAIAQDDDVTTPNLADLDVSMADAAPEPDSDFNAAPPALPELFDENNRPVPYIIDLMLGKDGVKKEAYDAKDENGNKTGQKAAYFTADLLGKVIGPADAREGLDIRNFDSFVRPPSRYTSFVQRGKQLSEIAHLGKLAGLDITAYATVGEMAPDLAKQLHQRGENSVQVKGFIQWQWYSKNHEWTNQKGDKKKGKTLRYGMKNADEQRPDGSWNPKIVHKETGEELTARAVLIRIEAL